MSKNTKMKHLLRFRLRVTLADTRIMTGYMVAFDKYTNLVLADCEEIRRIKPKQGVSSKAEQERQQKRTLGLVILRGEHYVAMSVDAPPPPSLEGQQALLPQPSPPASFGVPPLGMIPPLGFRPMGQPGALPSGTPPSGIPAHRVPTLGVPPPGFRPGVGSFTFPFSLRPAPRNQHTL
ncbi:MAG: small nuclear ribonucleoprotein [Linnemannia gamsii]|nr:MAG: small nuclear ribonucleoprotein [Linnemannia gamsii]